MLKGIQQFQLRSVINAQSEAEKTLTRVKKAGYEGIELCTFLIEETPWIVKVLTRMAGMPIGRSGKLNWYDLIEKSGLKVVSLHDHLGSVLKNPIETVERAKKFNTKKIVITGMHHFDYTIHEEVLGLCRQLNQAGQILKEHGMKLLYHNHNTEFRRTELGQRAMDVIIENTDPDLVAFELDVYWAAEAGCDVLDLMETMGTRIQLMHVNDRGSRKKGKANSIIKTDSVELGFGNLNLKAFIDKARQLKVEAVVLETHKNWVEKSPLISMEVSSEFMNSHV